MLISYSCLGFFPFQLLIWYQRKKVLLDRCCMLDLRLAYRSPHFKFWRTWIWNHVFEDKESDFKLTHHKFFQCYCNTSLTHNFFFILQTTITLWKKLNQYIIKWGEHSFFFLSNEELVMNTMTGSHDHSAFLRCWWSHFFLSQQVKTKYLIHSLISNCRKRKWHSTPNFCFLLRFFYFLFLHTQIQCISPHISPAVLLWLEIWPFRYLLHRLMLLWLPDSTSGISWSFSSVLREWCF